MKAKFSARRHFDAKTRDEADNCMARAAFRQLLRVSAGRAACSLKLSTAPVGAL
jgi:hypothetical protein